MKTRTIISSERAFWSRGSMKRGRKQRHRLSRLCWTFDPRLVEFREWLLLRLFYVLFIMIVLLFLIWKLFLLILNFFLLIWNLDFWILSENTLSWASLANVDERLHDVSYLVYGFVTVVVELTQTTLVSLLSTAVTCLAHLTAAFTFLENIIPFSVISGIIAIVFGLWVWKLKKTNAKISEHSEVQKILISNLENEETLLRIEKKQHNATEKDLQKLMLESERQISTLESQNNKSNLKIEELCKENKDLQTNKLQLKLQKEKLELSMKKAGKQNRGLAADKLNLKSQINELNMTLKKAEKHNLKSQIKELNMTLKKAEKQNLIFKEDTLRMQSENKNLNLQLDKEKDEKLCVACVDNDKKMLLQPCNHLCLCEKCLAHKKWTECPVCRQHIKSTIHVYV